jgi:carboxypeptidase C (cathepsin A)
MRGFRASLLAAAVALAVCASASAQTPSASASLIAAPSRPDAAPDRATEHVLVVGGQDVRFRAAVETQRVSAAGGAPDEEYVVTSFVRLGGEPGPRPVTFAVNGGPGAASAWLNLGAIGPWRVGMGGRRPSPSAQPLLRPNDESWLAFTDLVFLDPAGTGWSRLLADDEATRRRVYSVDGDIQALAGVARRWLEAHGRLASPKMIVGESYGGFRGPRLAEAMRREHGVAVGALVLVSPVLDFAGRFTRHDPARFVSTLPSMAAVSRGATAPAGVRDAENYAAGDYLRDLMRGPGDREAVERASAAVAGLVGLDPALVRRRAARVDVSTFVREREPGRVASPYDATVVGADPFPEAQSSRWEDPVIDALRPVLTSAAIDLYRRLLDWRPPAGGPERRYELLNLSVNRQWRFDGPQPPESLDALRAALALDPRLRVLVAHGIADLVTPYFASKLLLDQVPPTEPPGRLELRAYGGGHMFYSQDSGRAALAAEGERLAGRAAEGYAPAPKASAPAP